MSTQKTPAKKTGIEKVATKKAATKKAVAKKAVAKKTAPGKAASKGVAPRNTALEKAPSKVAVEAKVAPEKASPPPGVSPGEKLLVLQFSYREHEWDEDAWDKPLEAYARVAREEAWRELGEMEWEETREYRVGRLSSLDALREEIVASMTVDLDLQSEVLLAPMDRLVEKMKTEGLEFVAGGFYDFEGNHCDTEICVVVRKAR